MTRKMTQVEKDDARIVQLVDGAIALVAQRGIEGHLDIDKSLDEYAAALTPAPEGEEEFVPSPRVAYLAEMYEGAATPPNGLNQGSLQRWESDNEHRLPSVGGELDHGQHLPNWEQ